MVEEKMKSEIQETKEELMELDEDRFHTVEVGQIIEAKVVLVRDDEAYVDIGGKSDLVIPLKELTGLPVTSAKEVVKAGDVIKVMVVRSGGEDGVLLSKRRVDQEKIWEDVSNYYEQGATLPATVSEVVKGGLKVKIKGINAFMPASQAALGFQANLAELVGREIQIKIIQFDRAKKRLVVSRRVLLEEEKKRAEAEFYQTVTEGKRMTGIVTRTTDFGAFVDLGSGVEGLIHISELSWDRVKSVTDVLHPGQKVEVIVIKVDSEHKRISLSLKQIQTHPWEEAIKNFQEGNVYPGTVTRLESFGAFIRLAPHLEGLAHVSQISEKRIGKPDEVLKVGDEVQVKIIKIDYENRKVSLSLKQVVEDRNNQEKKEFLNNQDDRPFTHSLGSLFKK